MSLKPILLALMAVLMASALLTAPASGDVLCEDKPVVAEPEEGIEACQVPYSETVGLEASAPEVVLSTSLSEVVCESTVAGKAKKDLGVGKGLEGALESLDFSSCEGFCASVEAQGLPYDFVSVSTAEGDANMTVSGEKENPTIVLSSCTFGITCTYAATELPLTFSGGENALIEAELVQVKRTAGSIFFCPATGSLSATYELQQPGGGQANQAPGRIGFGFEPFPVNFTMANQVKVVSIENTGTVAWRITEIGTVAAFDYELIDPFPPNLIACNGRNLAANASCAVGVKCKTASSTGKLVVHTSWAKVEDNLVC